MPVTLEQLQQLDRTQVAQPDSPTLDWFQKNDPVPGTFGTFGTSEDQGFVNDTFDAGKRIVNSFVPSMAEKVAGIQRAKAERDLQYFQDHPMSSEYKYLKANQERRIDKTEHNLADNIALAQGARQELNANSPQSFTEGIVGGIVNMIPAMLSAAPTMGLSIIADMGLGGFGAKYEQLREQGISSDEAFKSAGVTGSLFAAAGMLPVSALAKPFMSPVRKYVTVTLANTAGLTVAEAGSLLYDSQTVKPDMTLGEFFTDLGSTTLTGLGQGLLMTPFHSAGKGIESAIIKRTVGRRIVSDLTAKGMGMEDAIRTRDEYLKTNFGIGQGMLERLPDSSGSRVNNLPPIVIDGEVMSEPGKPPEGSIIPKPELNGEKSQTIEELVQKTEELKKNASDETKVQADINDINEIVKPEVQSEVKAKEEQQQNEQIAKKKEGKRRTRKGNVIVSREVRTEQPDLSESSQRAEEMDQYSRELEQSTEQVQPPETRNEQPETVQEVRDVVGQNGEDLSSVPEQSDVTPNEVTTIEPIAEQKTPTSQERLLSYIDNNKGDFKHNKPIALAKLASVSGLKPTEVKTFLTEQGMYKDGKFIDKNAETAIKQSKTLKAGTEITDPDVVRALTPGEHPIVMSTDGKTAYVDFETVKVLSDADIESGGEGLSGTQVWDALHAIKEQTPDLKVIIVDSSSEEAGKFTVAGKMSFDKTAGTTKQRFLEWATKVGVDTGEVSTVEERALLAKQQVRLVPTTTKVRDKKVPTWKIQSLGKDGKWTTMNVTEFGKGKRQGAKYKIYANEREAIDDALSIARKKEAGPLGEAVESVKKNTEPPINDQQVTITLDDGTKFGPFASEEVAQRMIESNGWKDVKIEKIADTKTGEEKQVLDKLEESFSVDKEQSRTYTDEARKSDNFITLDNLGLQQLYEKIRGTKTVSDLISHAQTYANHLYESGVRTFDLFRREFKRFFGPERFAKVKDFVNLAWYNAKEAVWNILESGERGSFSTKPVKEASAARKKAEALVAKMEALETEAAKEGKTLEEFFKSRGGTQEVWDKMWEAAGDLYKKKRAKREGLKPDTMLGHIFGISEQLDLPPSKLYELSARILKEKAPKANEDFFRNLAPEQVKELWTAMNMLYVDAKGEQFKPRRRTKKPTVNVEEPTELQALSHFGKYLTQRGQEWLNTTETGKVIRQKIENVLNKADIWSGKLLAPLFMSRKYIEKHNDRLLLLYLGKEEFWKGVEKAEVEAVQAGIELSERSKIPELDAEIVKSLSTLYGSIGRGMEDRFMTVTTLLAKDGKLKAELYRHNPAEAYFPHMFQWAEIKNGGQRRDQMVKHIQDRYGVTKGAAIQILDKVMRNQSASKKFGNMEYARDFKSPGWDRNILRVSTEYTTRGTKRLLSIDEFGKKGEKAAELVAKHVEEGGYGKGAMEILNNTIGTGEQIEHIMSKAVNILTTYEIITKMGLSAVTNATQSVNTWGLSDLKTMFRTIQKLHGKDKVAARQFAYETGAMLGTVMKEYMDWTKGDDLASQFLDKTGFSTVEIYNRLFAAVAGKEFAKEQFSRLVNSKQGSKEFNTAARKLRRINMEFSPEELLTKRELTDDELRYAGLQMSNKTQFRSNALTLPLFMTSGSGAKPIWRAITLLHSFSYHQSTMMKDLFKENKVRTIQTAIGMMAVGAALDELKRLLRLKRPPKDTSDAFWGALGSAGGFGMAFDLMAAAARGNDGLNAYFGGPITGDISRIAGDFISGLSGVVTGKPEKLKGLGKDIVGVTPYVAARTLGPVAGAVSSAAQPAIKNLIFQPKGTWPGKE